MVAANARQKRGDPATYIVSLPYSHSYRLFRTKYVHPERRYAPRGTVPGISNGLAATHNLSPGGG